jgi:NAD(P)H dehydrogenase (quinone)
MNIERVIPIGDVPPGSKNIEFENRPDVGIYEALVFGDPVMHFLFHRQ